jgi:phosphatidate cytidylyltransferase
LSARRVLIGLLLTTVLLGILSVDVFLDTAAGTFGLALLCLSPALAELLILLKRGGSHTYLKVGLFLGVGMMLARGVLELAVVFDDGCLRTAAILGPFAVLGVILLLVDRRRFGPTLLGLVWVAGALILLLDLRLTGGPDVALGIPFGLGILLTVAASTKGGDTAAYVVGRTIGRMPMAPRISPKKTWEGAAAGFIVGTLAAPLFGMLLGFPSTFGVTKLLLLGAAVNVAGQLGDLAESWVKRRANKKDSGEYLGELGGALDIMDALLAAGPVAYFVVRLLGTS